MNALIVLAALGGIGIRGQLTCPTVQQIDARLAGVVQPDAENLRWVEVTAEPGMVVLTLRSAKDELEAVRTIPLPASCDELASASAVAIATWAATPPKPAPPPSAAIEPDPDEPIFDAYALKAMRQQSLLPGPPEPERPSRAGPIITTLLGAALEGTAIGLAVGAPGGNETWRTLGVGMVALGTGTLIAAIVWWVQQAATAPHGAEN